MKLKDLLNITYPYTEIAIYDESIMQGDFYASTKQVDNRYMERTIDQVSTNEHGTLEILLERILRK